MSLEQRLTDDMKAAMRAGEKDVLGVVRRVLAALKNARIEKRADLDQQDEIKVVRSIAKQHKESIEQFRAAGREDLATKEEAELVILTVYLPPEMDEAQLDAIIDKVIAETGASSMKDMGTVIKAVMARTGGQAEGGVVSATVKDRLGG
ncbi:MAG: GatB/YqeY domain-containing protein [Actinobacteria bacterium]|nr:GatB/YqeY domain-containing protein [Actinomycetota bacterium]MBM3697813.1 GatB/YqeY domain-containing protein [Actinomycetota bacterium]